MATDIPKAELEPRRIRWLFIASIPFAALTVAVSLWWSYGDGSTLVEGVAVGLWIFTGVVGFVSGYRGEHPELNASPLVGGLLTAVATLGATVILAGVANYRTHVDERLEAPVSGPLQWPALVEPAARESGNRKVLSVLCDQRLEADYGSCAVTYEGPKCQYWFVGSVDGVDEVERDEEIVDGRANFDPAFGALCGV